MGANEEIDIVSPVIGKFGRWQLIVSIIMGLLKYSVGYFQLGIVFLAPDQSFYCANSTHITDPDSNVTYDECFINSDSSGGDKIPCTNFVYDDSVFVRTIVSEWDLVCTKSFFVELTQMAFMLGNLVGFLVFGVLADKFGRRFPLIVAIIIQVLACLLETFSPWYPLFIVARFILAIASGGISVISFVLCIEVCGGKWRTIVPILYQIPVGVGASTIALSSFLLRDWRKMEFSLFVLSALLILCVFFIPESPRWLLVTKRNEKAIELIKRIVKINKMELTSTEALERDETEEISEKSDGSLGMLFRDKKLRTFTLILGIQWLGTGISYFAFTQYLGVVTANAFITFSLGGMMILPGAFVCILMAKYFGRKTTIMAFQVLTGACFLIILAFPKGAYAGDWPRLLFSCVGVFGISVFLPMLWLYTGELYPTVVRNIGIGLVSMMTKIGSILAPLILSLEKTANFLPLVVLGVLTIALAVIMVPLPETKRSPTTDTVHPDENSNQKNEKDFNKKYHKIIESEGL